MKRRETGENFSVMRFTGRVYKKIAINSELIARVRGESNRVVYKGIVGETVA